MGPAFVETCAGRQIPRHRTTATRAIERNPLGLHTGLDMRNQTLEFMPSQLRKEPARTTTGSRGASTIGRSARTASRKSVGAEKHILQRPHRLRRHGCRTAAADRQGLATLRRQGISRPDGDAEGEVQRLRDHHPQQVVSPSRVAGSRRPRTSHRSHCSSNEMLCIPQSRAPL